MAVKYSQGVKDYSVDASRVYLQSIYYRTSTLLTLYVIVTLARFMAPSF